jgi:protein O-mannosyl-transferase
MATPASNSPRLFLAIALVLAAVTSALYWPATHHDFINLDDQVYVAANPHIQEGLTWRSLAWAFQIGYAAYWHPVTWISHAMDCQLFGLNPGGHHLTSILFHIANTLLLFALLHQLTGAMWRSGMVAALFAWHPVHVESVAWACERKDVLSTFFWLLTLMAYGRYAQKSEAGPPSSALRSLTSGFYWPALFCFALGLMSKPMIVTLPCVLLLMDFWPLNRIGISDFKFRNYMPLLLEKIPFLALTIATSVITYLAQKGGGAVWSEGLPLQTRLANSFVSYLRYIGKTIWPENLCVIYPYQQHWPGWLVLAAVLTVVGLSIWAMIRLNRQPWLAFGWFWFIGTLVPTIGIVQVGPQAMADRFNYVPSIGLFIMLVWGVAGSFDSSSAWKKILPFAGALVLGLCLISTQIQLRYWQNNFTLFNRAIAVTSGNYVAYNCLGSAYLGTGQSKEALTCFRKAVEADPHFAQAQFNLGRGELDEGDVHDAARHLLAAVSLVPDDPAVRIFLARALARDGRIDWAVLQLQKALAMDASYFYALNDLAWLYATSADAAFRNGGLAVKLAQQACELTQGRQPDYLLTLAAAYAETGNFHDATIIAQSARKLALVAGQSATVVKADKFLDLFAKRQTVRE